jgi:hypothetical protein
MLSHKQIMLRQTVPDGWHFDSGPHIYLYGARIRIEIPWPKGMEQGPLPLSAINAKPGGDGRWVVGVMYNGGTSLMQVSQTQPHVLISGASGSGKSTAMRCAVYQLSQDDANQLVLLDGKKGEGLACVAGCKNVIGPLATDIHEIRGALQWVVNEMETRYEHMGNGYLDKQPRIILVFDEFQELTRKGTGDPATIEMIRRLSAQSRAAKISMILGTQSPNLDVFGTHETRKNLDNRIALKVGTHSESIVSLGVRNPSAHHLAGCGDAYTRAGDAVHRVQCVWVDKLELTKQDHAPMMEAWPVFDPESLQPIEGYSVDELVVGLEVAAQGAGRGPLEEAGIGSTRARRLLPVVRTLWSNLSERGFRYVQNEIQKPVDQ